MRQRRRIGVSLAGLAALIIGAGVTSCGSQHASTAPKATPGRTASRPPASTVTRQAFAPSGTRARAERLALHLLATAALPPGSGRLPRRPLPAALRGTGAVFGDDPSVFAYRLYRVPMPASQVTSFLQAHLPRREVADGTGSGGRYGVTTSWDLIAQERVLPPGIALAVLDYTAVPGPADSALLRVRARVTWYRPRPAAEKLRPASYRSVTLLAIPAGRGKRVSKTITSRMLISRLAGMVDALNVGTPTHSCTLPSEELSLQFNPVAAGQPAVWIASSGCAVYFVRLGHATERPLSMAHSDLTATLARLLHVPPLR